MSVSGGKILLRRASDGKMRSIRAPGGAVDAELETTGLYYAYNLPSSRWRGRIVFVPFSRLFG